MLHHEDGSRTFLGEPAPPDALARLCVLAGGLPEPLATTLAPEIWGGLRRSAKQSVIGRNVRRAVDAAGGVPRGELVTLVGGCACDPEVIEAVAAELGDLDVAVARGNVLGRHGPRAAVAVGLVLAYAAAVSEPLVLALVAGDVPHAALVSARRGASRRRACRSPSSAARVAGTNSGAPPRRARYSDSASASAPTERVPCSPRLRRRPISQAGRRARVRAGRGTDRGAPPVATAPRDRA